MGYADDYDIYDDAEDLDTRPRTCTIKYVLAMKLGETELAYHLMYHVGGEIACRWFPKSTTRIVGNKIYHESWV
jgi:hypothetical protein